MSILFPSYVVPTFPDFSALLTPYCHSLHKQKTEIEASLSHPSHPATPRGDKTWDIFWELAQLGMGIPLPTL